jgi:zinc protease
VRALPPVLLLAALLGAVHAADAPPRVETWALDAGTTGALVEDHRTAVVAVVLEFPVGSWSPWARSAHGVEAFEMQRFDPEGRLRADGDRLAADVDTQADERSLRLAATCLKSDLPEVMALLKRILSNRDLDESELKRRKRGQELEWKASLKQPFFVARQASVRALFAPGDPRRLAVEKPEPDTTDAERLVATRDAIVRLPGRVAGFAGDVTRAEVERLVAGLLPETDAKLPPDLAPAFQPILPERERKDTTVPLPRLTQVYFAFGRESLPYPDADYPAFVVADHVLGGHFYSRLYVALRHEGGETYGAGTQNLGDVVIGAYGLGTFTRTANASATETKLREALRIFREKGITEQEREDAIGYLRGRRAFDRQSPGQTLRRWLRERRLGLEDGFTERLPDRAAALSLDEINAFIARYYDPARFTMVKVAPKD